MGATEEYMPVRLQSLLDVPAGHELPPSRICRIAAQVALELASLHERGELHGPLNPVDVLVDPESGRVELTGRPGHENPNATVACDLHALGALLYEMSCGQRPTATREHTQGESERAPSRVFGEPERPEGIAEPLWCVIESLLDPDPAHRPAGASEVAAQLSVFAITLADEEPAPRRQPAAPSTATDAGSGTNGEDSVAASETAGAEEAAEAAEAAGADEERVYRLSGDHEPTRRRPARVARPAAKPRRARRPRPTSVPSPAARERGPAPAPATAPRPDASARNTRRKRMVGAVVGLALLGAASFGVTWVAMSARDDGAVQPARVEVLNPTSGPLRTIEPAVGIGAGQAARPGQRAE